MATGLTNLKIYQMAKALELEVYEVLKNFPKDEKYRSVDQLKRSSSSVANNIAESYNKQSAKDKIHILRDVSISEAEETESNLLRCADKKFLLHGEAQNIADGYVELKKAIYGYIRFIKNRSEKN